jgi:DNA-binding HxlR family transcriptional regulator
MKKQASINTTMMCKKRITAIRDTMEILSGKWKFHILGTFAKWFHAFYGSFTGSGRYYPKMLSKELQDMEMNQLVTRTVLYTKPVTVAYDVTGLVKPWKKLLMK